MHVYIYDSFVNQKKYDKVLARIETRVTDLGLNGKISRLGPMRDINDLVSNELKRGAKTITAVGNDSTICQIINSLGGQDVPLGLIPIGKNNNLISESLGIGIEEKACDVLSARRIIKMDLGQANNNYFLTKAIITDDGTTIEIDKNYSIEIIEKGEVSIINLETGEIDKKQENEIIHDPKDGILELLIKTKQSKNFLKKLTGQSVFPFKEISINNNKKHPVIIDDSIKINTPAKITISDKKLNIIVGKERNF